jgi:proteasome lid subunit RPN8/RPN11
VLVVARDAYEEILEHARTAVPREACGLLGGYCAGQRTYVQTAHRAPNAAETPRLRYRIDPAVQYDLMDGIESAGSQMVGIYHSHPAGPPSPSEEDRASATWADYPYVIVSLAGSWPTLDAWRYTGDTFSEETVSVSDSITDEHQRPARSQ